MTQAATVTPATRIFFKTLMDDGYAPEQTHCKWHLPQADQPGEWMPPVEGNIIVARNGYHVSAGTNLLNWLLSNSIYIAELDGELSDRGCEVAARRARLLKRLDFDIRKMLLFAADCVEHALNLVTTTSEKKQPITNAIDIVRRYVNAQATLQDVTEINAQFNLSTLVYDSPFAYFIVAAWHLTENTFKHMHLMTAANNAAHALAYTAAENGCIDILSDEWDELYRATFEAERAWQYQRLLNNFLPITQPPPGSKANRLIDVIRQQFILDWNGIHGAAHWARVRQNGLGLAKVTGANTKVVELFAFLHDSKRMDDGGDRDHGKRAVELARSLRGTFINVTDEEFELLAYACAYHSDGLTDADITVQTCWDADRLDLGRVGTKPDPRYLCTDAAKDPAMIEWAYQRSRSHYGLR